MPDRPLGTNEVAATQPAGCFQRIGRARFTILDPIDPPV